MRAQLILVGDFVREDEIKAYWKDKIGLSDAHFIKTIHIKRKKPIYKPYYGVCNIIVNSAYLKNKISRWIQLMSEEIGEEKYKTAGIV